MDKHEIMGPERGVGEVYSFFRWFVYALSKKVCSHKVNIPLEERWKTSKIRYKTCKIVDADECCGEKQGKNRV